MERPKVASPYAIAIDAARDTIALRARRYKWLVIAVSLAGLAAAGAALGLRSGQPLLALVLLPSMVIGHFALDLRAVHRWRRVAIDAWVAGTLRFDLLAKTLQSVPGLPASTVQGMLECLPAWNGQVPPAARPAMAAAQQRLGGLAEAALALRSAVWFVAALVALGAWTTGWPEPLGALLLLPAGAAAWRAARMRAVGRIRATLLRNWHNAAIDESRGRAWLEQFNWQGLTHRLQAAWHAGAAG